MIKEMRQNKKAKTVTVVGTADKGIYRSEIEFGKVQMEIEFSARSQFARMLKAKSGDKIEVTFKVLRGKK